MTTQTEVTESQAGAPSHGISLRDAIGVWARVAALSFGGPVGQIAVMHEKVDPLHASNTQE